MPTAHSQFPFPLVRTQQVRHLRVTGDDIRLLRPCDHSPFSILNSQFRIRQPWRIAL